MSSIFSKITSGEIPAFKVAETEKFLAFLDVRPLVKGHVLCIPKQEVDYIFDMSDDLYAELMLFAKIVAKGLKKVVECKKIGISVIGLEVPHAHVHLIPMNTIADMSFTAERIEMSNEEFSALAKEIAQAIIS
jgi:histidine triad (HIT) family protein